MCLENLSDDDLVRIVQGGDQSPLNVLVPRHQWRLFAWLLKRGLKRHDAEDVLQNLWLRILGTIHKYRCGSGTFLTWLFFQLRSFLSTCTRSRSGCREVSLEDVFAVAETKFGTGVDPTVDLLRAEDWEKLERLLRELPVEKRQVIELWFLFGLNGPTIAQQLGIPELTVHSRKLAALRKLRELLNNEGGEL